MKASARRILGAAVAGAALALAACAPVPRPPVLGDVDRVREGAAAAEARTYAPDALAHAEKIRREAEAAFAAGDLAGAQLLGERAIAAYAHAHAIARAARAAEGTADAERVLAAAGADLAALEADQMRVAADADALEARVRVAAGAQPIQPSGRAEPERERARLAAARALALEARLLCGAARLLVQQQQAGSSPPDAKVLSQLEEASAALAKVETEVAPASVPAAPIDGATRARAGCLAALTAVRRAQTPVSRAPGAGDALLAQISATGSFAPSRDDRGVVVTLRGIFSGANLNAAGDARVTELGKIAAAHPTFPVEVVIHSDRPIGAGEETAERARAEQVVKALTKASGPAIKVLPVVAGNATPVVDPAGSARARNARVEIVFVTPESF